MVQRNYGTTSLWYNVIMVQRHYGTTLHRKLTPSKRACMYLPFVLCSPAFVVHKAMLLSCVGIYAEKIRTVLFLLFLCGQPSFSVSPTIAPRNLVVSFPSITVHISTFQHVFFSLVKNC